MKKLILILLLLTTPLYAANPWSDSDIQREVACITLNLMDYATTDRILNENPRAIEANPFLSQHPTRNELMAFTAGSTAIHMLVTHYISAKYRPYWQLSWIAVKLGVVGNNLHVGVGVQF